VVVTKVSTEISDEAMSIEDLSPSIKLSIANTKVNEVFRRARVNEDLHRRVIQRPKYDGRS